MINDPYSADIDPEVGGQVRVSVSGWGYWNVWIGVESYHDAFGDADTVIQPAEAARLAQRLIVAAVVCWWKRLPDQLRGRLNRRSFDDGGES